MSRIISDLRNGFCVCIIENSRKTFYFSKNTIHPDVVEKLSGCKMVATKEYFNHHFKGSKIKNVVLGFDRIFLSDADKTDDIAIEIAKTAELQPILIKVDTIPDFIPHEEIKIDDIDFDIKNFRYDITMLAKAQIQLTKAPNAEIYAFCSKFGGHEHYAILINDPLKEKTPLVRIHSSCYTGDLLASLRCDCRDQLQDSIAEMNKTSGILLYIMQEGRGIGLANKILAYNFQQEEGLDTVESNFAVGFEDDERSFVPAFKILEYFGKTSIRLLTNNPKKIKDLASCNIKVVETIPTYFQPHKHNEEYLKVKKEKMGHKFGVE